MEMNLRHPLSGISEMARGSFLAVLLFAITGCSGCSHLFYQPSNRQFMDPKAHGMPYEEVEFPSGSADASVGQATLVGWFFPAQLKAGEKAKGTFVQFHGNAENISTHFASLVWVTQSGYNLFTFDYRGYGASGGSPSQEGLNQDALAAISYVEKKTDTPIILYGQSLGGAVLLRALNDVPAQERSRFRLVVIDSSFYSYKTVARKILARNWLTFIFQPLGYVLVSDAYSPEDVISKVSPIPMLVIAGDQDPVVPYSQGQKIYELAGNPKWFWTIEGGHHIDSTFKDHGKYRTQLLQFIDGLTTQKPSLTEAPQKKSSF